MLGFSSDESSEGIAVELGSEGEWELEVCSPPPPLAAEAWKQHKQHAARLPKHQQLASQVSSLPQAVASTKAAAVSTMAGSTRRRNATVTTPLTAGKSAGKGGAACRVERSAAEAAKAAVAAPALHGKAAAEGTLGSAGPAGRSSRKRGPPAATADSSLRENEPHNAQAAPAAAAEQEARAAAPASKRQRRASNNRISAPAADSALAAAAAPAGCQAADVERRRSKRHQQQQQAQGTEPEQARAPPSPAQTAPATDVPTAAVAVPQPGTRAKQALQAPPPPQQQHWQAPWRQQEEPLTSMGPEPSQSLADSVKKFPSPKHREKPTASTAAVGPSLAARLAAVPAAAAAAAAAVDHGAVDQPMPQQQQVPVAAAAELAPAEAAAAAAAVQLPQAAPAAAAAGGIQQPAAAAAGAALLPQQLPPHLNGSPGASNAIGEAGGSAGSPLLAGGAAGAAGGGGAVDSPNVSTAAQRSPGRHAGTPNSTRGVPAAAAAAAARAAEAGWWHPLDPEKVRAVKAALHISSYSKGSIPVCRERQAAAVGGWLRQQLQQQRGGSIYLSGLPGTGKSLTAHEMLRQCWRQASDATTAEPDAGSTGAGSSAAATSLQALPAPALISINCMSITDPKQVAERILLGYAMACAAQHPEAALAAGEEPIMFPAAARTGGAAIAAAAADAGGDPLHQLRRLVLSPLPSVGTARTSAVGKQAASPAAAQPNAAPAAKKGGGKAHKKGGGKGRKRKADDNDAPTAAGAATASSGGERGMVVVVLDELDSLLSGTRGEELVESLFALAHADRSRLLLLGIANSIDLVQQLMRPGGTLHRHNLRPAHELFPAYLRHQFSQVLHQRLATLPGRVFEPNAIELCSRKMANGSGDMRRALEACAQALDLAVKEAAAAAAEAEEAAAEAAAVAAAGGAVGGAPAGGAPAAAAAAARLVGMRQMAVSLSRITGGIGLGNDNVRAIRALPPQQQLLMCTVGKLLGESLGSRGLPVRAPAPMPSPGSSRKAAGGTAAASRARAAFMSPAKSVSSMRSGGSLISGGGGSIMSGMPRSREVLLGQLEEVFTHLCKQVGMQPYTTGEFSSATSNLQDLGLIGLAPAREAKWRRVTLRVPEDDVVLALADVPVLKIVVGA